MTTTTGNYYRIQITHPDGTREQKQLWANGATNAHWQASQLHPDCQVSVMGVVPIYDAE